MVNRTPRRRVRDRARHAVGLTRLAVDIASMMMRDDTVGLQRMRRDLAFQLLQREADLITFRRQGILWTAPVSDLVVTYALFRDGGFQHAELHALVAWLIHQGYLGEEKTTIVEVGANIGTSSITLAQETGRRVIAVEPVLSNVGLLRQNVEQNGLHERITCVHAAVCDQVGRVTMILDPHNSGAGQIWEQQSGVATAGMSSDGEPLIDVPATTLDDLAMAYQVVPSEIALVWSDTQGYERHVIESGPSLWPAGVPLFVEIWPHGLRMYGEIEQFIAVVDHYFDGMVMRDDLIRLGVQARPRPVSDLYTTIASLERDDYTDVLLLPRCGAM